jgi:N-acetylglucosamine kinase-like BadF-type ATPase
MPGFVLGMDGGQTSTTAAVCDLSGRLLGLGRAGPANHVWEPGGVRRARRAVKGSTAEALKAAGLPGHTILHAAFLGITGTKEDGRTEQALRECVKAKRLRVANDKVNALASVTAGKPGVVVIAGTGTIAYGENSRGRCATASGWGFLLGDEGAGFWIARKAIAAACRADDGRGDETALTHTLLAQAGVRDLWDLHFLIYSGKLSRSDIADLARAVPAAADQGDQTARSVLREAGAELGLAAGAVACRLGMHRAQTVVGMVGGVFGASSEVCRSFRREVRKHMPRARFAPGRFAPVVGSVILALKMAGVRLTRATLANLETASAEIGDK